MTKREAANSVISAKPRGRPFQPGQSGNPSGRPKEGQSWNAIVREVTDKTPEELAAIVGPRSMLGQAFAKMPKGIPLKTLIVMRICAALMFDPSSALFRAMLDAQDMADLDARLDAIEAAMKARPNTALNSGDVKP